MKTSKNKLILGLIILVLVTYFSFGLNHITKFNTADEDLWISNPVTGRIHNYWNALSDRDWKETRINDKPGITLAYISGIGLLFEKDPEAPIVRNVTGEEFKIYDPGETEKKNFIFRLPLLIFNGLFALLLFWLVKKLTENSWIALLTFSFILLSPILLGISQIINPDTLLWPFSFASIISFFLFLKTIRWKYSLLAGLFLGLSLLSKYTSIVILPFFFASILFFAFFLFHKWKKQEFPQKIKRFSAGFYLTTISSFIVFVLGMPAVFTKWEYFYEGTYGFDGMEPIFWSIMIVNLFLLLEAFLAKSRWTYLLFVKLQALRSYIPTLVYSFLALIFIINIVNWSNLGQNFLGVPDLSYDIARGKNFLKVDLWKKIVLEIRPLAFSLPPLVLISIIFLWIKSTINFKKINIFVFLASFFYLIFWTAVLFQGLLVHIRYSIMLYPLSAFLAAYGLLELGKIIHPKIIKNNIHKNVILWILIAATSIYSIFMIKPFYFNYTNFIYPKDDIITGAWGYGGYEAAQYLNNLPDSENLMVWSDYKGVCSFFKGKCIQGSRVKDLLEKDTVHEIDYFVTTRRGKILNKSTWHKLHNEHEHGPIWALYIDDRPDNYVKIFRNTKANDYTLEDYPES